MTQFIFFSKLIAWFIFFKFLCVKTTVRVRVRVRSPEHIKKSALCRVRPEHQNRVCGYSLISNILSTFRRSSTYIFNNVCKNIFLKKVWTIIFWCIFYKKGFNNTAFSINMQMNYLALITRNKFTSLTLSQNLVNFVLDSKQYSKQFIEHTILGTLTNL